MPTIPDVTEQNTSRFIQRTLIVTAIVLGLGLVWFAADVLLLVFAGILLAVLLRSLSGWLAERSPLSPGWALGVVVLAILALSTWAGALLAPDIASQADQLAAQLPQAAAEARTSIAQYRWGELLLQQVPNADDLADNQSQVLATATGFFSTTLGALANIAIVLFIGLYLAAEPRVYTGGLLRLVPRSRRRRASAVLTTLGYTLRWWLIGRAFSMLVVGSVTALGLWLLGVPLALTLGLLAGLLDFIPNIGPIIAAVPGLLLALPGGPSQALYVVLLYLAIQTAEAYVITPLVERRAVLLPPVLTIVAQIVLGVAFGLLGLLLATPLMAVVLVLIKLLYVEDVLGDSLDVPGEPEL